MRSARGWLIALAGLAALIAWWALRDARDTGVDAQPGGAAPAGRVEGTGAIDAPGGKPRVRATGTDGAADTLPGARATYTIRGFAWDGGDHARPLAGVLVRALARAARGTDGTETEEDPLLRDAAPAVAAETRTGTDGSFRIDVPHDGPWRVVATLDGHLDGYATCRAGDLDVGLELPRIERTSVQVTDGMGDPVAGAELRVGWGERDTPPHAVVVTGADGRAAIPAHPGGALVARAAGFALLRTVWDERPPERIVLRRGLPCGGTVVDTAGAPVAGAEVVCEADEEPRRVVVTGPAGRFAFDGTAGAALRVSAEGFVESLTGVVPGDLEMRVALRRSAVVEGVVTGPPGWVGGEGVQVTIESGHVAFTDASHFRAIVPAGRVRIDARADLGGRYQTPLIGSADVVADPAAPVRDVQIVLGAPEDLSFVTVEVPDAAGPPARASRIFALREGEYLGGVVLEAGSPTVFPLRVAPGTDVELRGYLDDGGPAQATLVVPSVRTGIVLPYPRVVLRPVTGPALRVRLVEGGRERPDLLDRLNVSARPAGPGRWTLSPFAPGARISFAADGWASVQVNYVAPGWDSWRDWFARGEFPEFELAIPLRRPASVRARVVDAAGKPLPGGGSWQLTVATGIPLSHTVNGPTAPDGSLRVADLPPGRAVLDVHPESGPAIRREFDIDEGATVDLGDLVSARPAARWYDGVATDETGRPLGGVTILPQYADGGFADERTWSAPDGSWRVRAPDVAGVRFLCTKAGRGRTVVTAAPRDGRTTVLLPRGGSVLVRIVRRPVGARVDGFLRTPGDKVQFGAPMRTAAPDRGDWRSWICDDIAAGPVEVVIQTRAGELVRRVDVVAGGTVEAVFGAE